MKKENFLIIIGTITAIVIFTIFIFREKNIFQIQARKTDEERDTAGHGQSGHDDRLDFGAASAEVDILIFFIELAKNT